MTAPSVLAARPSPLQGKRRKSPTLMPCGFGTASVQSSLVSGPEPAGRSTFVVLAPHGRRPYVLSHVGGFTGGLGRVSCESCMSLLARVARVIRAVVRAPQPMPASSEAPPFPPRPGHAPALTPAERALCAAWFERLLRTAEPGQPITIPRSALARLISTLRQ